MTEISLHGWYSLPSEYLFEEAELDFLFFKDFNVYGEDMDQPFWQTLFSYNENAMDSDHNLSNRASAGDLSQTGPTTPERFTSPSVNANDSLLDTGLLQIGTLTASETFSCTSSATKMPLLLQPSGTSPPSSTSNGLFDPPLKTPEHHKLSNLPVDQSKQYTTPTLSISTSPPAAYVCSRCGKGLPKMPSIVSTPFPPVLCTLFTLFHQFPHSASHKTRPVPRTRLYASYSQES